LSGLIDTPAAGRLDSVVEGAGVFALYRRQPGRLIIDHVEAPVALRGTGAAGHFMAALAEIARAKGDKIVPLCGYAAAWFRRNPQHHDVLAESGGA
jgi:predicted GNAT family acetyltransferase